MPTFDKQKVNVGVSNHSKLDVSSTHITTSSFMQLAPVYYRHMLPGESIKGNANVLARLAPVAVPTYGRCRINLRAFFVPFRCVFPNFNEFIVDTIAVNASNSSLVSGSPIIKNSTLCTYFLTQVGPDNSPLVSAVGTNDPYDILTATNVKYKLSYYGRHYLKILQSLGYRVIWDDKTQQDLVYSALPLLCYAKVYVDWYANQAYLDSQQYLDIQKMFKYNTPNGQFEIDLTGLFTIFEYVHIVCYDNGNDVYVNAWDNPMAPNSGLYSSSLNGTDVSGGSANSSFQVLLDSNGTPYMSQSAASSTSIGTEYLHELLKSLTDYVKRNQLSGAAQIDRFLARFGINLNSAVVNRSIYVTSQSVDVDFGSVMSNANTAASGDPSNLGDYAGQGLGRGQMDIDFKTDEFGLFIVTSSVVPAASLYQGIDRNNLHIDKTDFFTPEFDNLGCQAIAKGEVYVSTNGNFGSPDGYKAPFGFAPRYYEYKQSHDYVTGDYVCPAAFVGGDSWHLNRELTDSTFGSIINLHHGLFFTRGGDASQYDRIFNYTGLQDKFYLVYHFACQSLAPCKSLFDTYDFDDAGNKLSMNGNNAKVN